MGEKVYGVRFNVEGVDKSVGKFKNLVYMVNAVRLSIKDIEMVMRGPTIQNVMWMAIQLTRTYTHVRRLLKMIAKEQDAVLAKSLAIRATTAGTAFQTRLGVGGRMVPSPGMFATAAGLYAAAGPWGPIVIGGVVIGTAAAGLYWQQEQAKKAHRERMREIARTQGIEG